MAKLYKCLDHLTCMAQYAIVLRVCRAKEKINYSLLITAIETLIYIIKYVDQE